MMRLALIFCLFISLHALSQGINKVVPPKPATPRLVNDLAAVLTAEQEHALEQKLVAYDDSTSTQIVVITISTTQDYPIEDVGLKILRDWGVGDKEKDNGILILAAIKDKDITIQNGYGMEGVIPDITAKNIIENDILPGFRDGNYYRGLDAGTNSIIRAAAGEYVAPAGYRNRGNGKGGLSLGKIIFGFILLMVVMNMFGGGGGRGGGFMSRRGYRGLGGPVFFPGSFGGSGGGFGGGFGGGGGGFGGFGGGGGGGGGASGSW